ncbi:hypothetical protein [Halapricum desulfuricans]|uniref:Uncharacterized protein n=1 Tax=Halapricum desulfuricans TaxID=2841257 RepID=A0A897NZY4_9EURY|nr:hypothetical protein [Halapricum desulfuricans]QSG16129.1 hypothetical protein HSEST_2619 [Halapricum desulfuricans]
MYRRRMLTVLGAGLAAGSFAGCADPGEQATSTPTPRPSRLRIRVENESDEIHDVTFRLDVRTAGADRYEFFRLTAIEPGTTREADPRDLEAGTYELAVELPLGATTIGWAGHECTEKLVVVRFTEGATEVSGRCLDGD